MPCLKRVCGLLCLLALLSPALNVHAQVAEKKSGFMGDPARKRGVELGFDYGLKAGKTDFKEGKEANPREHGEYINPNPIYRYEYGYRASFNAGFRSGFLSGYKQTYGEEALPTQVTEVPEGKTLDKDEKPVETVQNSTLPPEKTETVQKPSTTTAQPVLASPSLNHSTTATPKVKIREKKVTTPVVVDAYSDAL